MLSKDVLAQTQVDSSREPIRDTDSRQVELFGADAYRQRMAQHRLVRLGGEVKPLRKACADLASVTRRVDHCLHPVRSEARREDQPGRRDNELAAYNAPYPCHVYLCGS